MEWFISGLGIYNGFNYNVHSVNVEDIDTRHILLDKYKRDFHDLNSTEMWYSEEDQKWNKSVESSCKLLSSGH